MSFLKPSRFNPLKHRANSILSYRPSLVIATPAPSEGGYLQDVKLGAPISPRFKFLTGTKSLLWSIGIFLICGKNFLTQIRNYLCYTLFTLGHRTYRLGATVPQRTWFAFGSVRDGFSTLTFTDTRQLWWLERKLDWRDFLKNLTKIFRLGITLSRRLYLTLFVILSLFILNSGTHLFNLNSTSVASDFLRQRIKTSTQPAPTLLQASNIYASAYRKEDKLPIVSILKHEVSQGETLDSLSNLYGISADTIRYNNDVNEELKIGSTVYLPWMDGYIYRVEEAVTPGKIEEIYQIEAADIIQENLAVLDPKTGEFTVDSLVLLPTSDLAEITVINDRIAAEKAAAEARAAAQARQAALARQAVSTVPVTAQVTPASGGFIWPTSGVISRCLQPGHVACDIANAAGPNIVSVQAGTVSAVYRFSVYGYGLAVVVDHGNGLQTLYAHMSDIYVSQGQNVTQGTALGRMGCTGLCTGTHLHFEVKRNGVNQNPLAYLP